MAESAILVEELQVKKHTIGQPMIFAGERYDK
jgi:hypothetical protein